MEDINEIETRRTPPVVKHLRFNLEEHDEEDSISNASDTSSVPEFADIHDVWDAIELCDEHGVPYEGLENLEDFVERLTMHFRKRTLLESEKSKVSL